MKKDSIDNNILAHISLNCKFQKWGNIKFTYRNREFWCKGYYIDTVGKNTKAIKEYIADQLKQR